MYRENGGGGGGRDTASIVKRGVVVLQGIREKSKVKAVLKARKVHFQS